MNDLAILQVSFVRNASDAGFQLIKACYLMMKLCEKFYQPILLPLLSFVAIL